MWTSQDATEIEVPIPVIDSAVAMRNLSALKSEPEAASRTVEVQMAHFEGDQDARLTQLKGAMCASMIITYAQGMAQLRTASKVYERSPNPEDVASIWRGGCIDRSALLEGIRAAYHAHPDLPNLLNDSRLGEAVVAGQRYLRTVVCLAGKLGFPIPCLVASLAYLDGSRSAWLPADLIQAQRGYLGAHTYEHVDAKGVFHTHRE